MDRDALARRPGNGGIRQGPLSHLVGRLRFRQLALLVALGEHRNLHRAAEAVHMAQPSATKVVRELERILGFRLFERVPRGMYPTPLGAEVLNFAKRVLAELQRFFEDLEVKRQGGNVQLIIGTVLGAAAEHVASAVAQLKARRPLLSIKLVSEPSEELVTLLLERKIDLAVATVVESESHAQIRYESLASELLCVVVKAGHPASRAPKLQLASLKEYPWILPPVPSPARQIIEQAFVEAKMQTPANIIESTSCFATLPILQHCDAIAVLPESVIRDPLRAGSVVRLPLLADKHWSNFGIVNRRDIPVSRAIAEFVRLLRGASPQAAEQQVYREQTATATLNHRPRVRSVDGKPTSTPRSFAVSDAE